MSTHNIRFCGEKVYKTLKNASYPSYIKNICSETLLGSSRQDNTKKYQNTGFQRESRKI